MIAAHRSSGSCLRTLLRASGVEQAALSRTVPLHLPRASSSCSVSAASTSQSRQASSSASIRPLSSTSRLSTSSRRDQPDPSTPSFNIPLTPRAARDINQLQAWLREAFPGLHFPDDIAAMMITHESWDHGVSAGHNRRLAFLGRRAMKFFLTIFLTTQNGVHLTQDKVNDILHTSKLGDGVGKALKLGEIMRWTPAVNDGQKGPKETGLYKIRGITVEALVGAIYHQHGAKVARSFFSSRILPALETMSEQEVEAMKGAIEGEARAGEAVLQALASANESSPSTASADEQGSSDREVGRVEEGSDNVFRPVITSVPSNTTSGARRRRTSSTSKGIPLEDESQSSGRTTEGSMVV